MTTTLDPKRIDADRFTLLAADSNQALGIAEYAIAFLRGDTPGEPDPRVLEKTQQFHIDAALCGLSALALKTNAPRILRDEALAYPTAPGETGACVFGSPDRVKTEKAIVANCAAVREWDSNGTNFGYNPELGHTAGEFGHNDFYAVAVNACQELGLDGATALRAMVCHDEIRGRLAEVFSLKTYKIDHVVHGAIASAAVYGALHALRGNATAEQIERAIGMTVAHYIPWRAIRAGKQLSDSKGASAAISAEAAVLSMQRCMRGFLGPRDIFRNPEAIFRFFEPTTSGAERWTELAPAPFDLVLAHAGEDFAVMGMHFKLGLYEHQSAGAIQGVLNLLAANPHLADPSNIKAIRIAAYEPAFGIIGNPAKMDPRTRQSADHSMAYIVARVLDKAARCAAAGQTLPTTATAGADAGELWKLLMLDPHDYAPDKITDAGTRSIMGRIAFTHGGPDYDAKYPEGIPTSLTITDTTGAEHDSGFVMFPAGHARNTTADLDDVLEHKFALLGAIACDDPADAVARLKSLPDATAEQLASIYNIPLAQREALE